MTRKWKLLMLLAAASLGIAGFITVDFVITPEPGVSLDNYDRLRPGMTLEQCEVLLGRHHSEGRADNPSGRLFGWTDRGRRTNVCLFIHGSNGAEDGTVVLEDSQVRQGLNSGSVLDVIRSVLHL